MKVEAVAWIDSEGQVWASMDEVPSHYLPPERMFRPLVYGDTAPPRPEASAPVGVVLTAKEREWLEYAVDHMADDSEPEDATCYEVLHGLMTRVDALAQQPAAVDEALDRLRREGYPRLWRADLVGGQISVVRMREILTAALAGQQQGGPQE